MLYEGHVSKVDTVGSGDTVDCVYQGRRFAIQKDFTEAVHIQQFAHRRTSYVQHVQVIRHAQWRTLGTIDQVLPRSSRTETQALPKIQGADQDVRQLDPEALGLSVNNIKI